MQQMGKHQIISASKTVQTCPQHEGHIFRNLSIVQKKEQDIFHFCWYWERPPATAEHNDRLICYVTCLESTVDKLVSLFLNGLIHWGLMALSAQIGYIMPSISMFQLKNEMNDKVDNVSW